MKYSNIKFSACFALVISTFFSSCLNHPAESITTDSSHKKSTVDTTALEVSAVPEDSLQIAVRNVIKKYPGVKADVKNGEILLTGPVKGLKLQYLITDLNELRPKKIENKLTVIK